jgi:NADP-dependent 3-hydroxy acid dehydrogenase YdfG
MTAIRDSIGLVTGASSGIGAATARALAAEGVHLILAARRTDRLEELAAELRSRYAVEVLTLPLDVRDAGAVSRSVGELPFRWQPISVLVNNAGLSRGLGKLHEGELADWEEMIDTNIKGLLYVSRAVIPGMVARRHGHVVNIGSIAGVDPYPGGAVYCGTKAFVGMLSRVLKMDLLGSPVRVTNIEPGLVETEFSIVRFHGDVSRAAGVYQGLQPLTAEDVADAILFAVTRPPHYNVQEMLLFATAQSAPTMVHREPPA